MSFGDVICKTLGDMGIPRKDVNVFGIHRDTQNRVVFAARANWTKPLRKRGAIIPYAQFPIAYAQARRDLLIGFFFKDGTFRRDADMLCSSFGGIEIPIYVVFFKTGRVNPARLLHGEARLRERPIVTR